MWKNSDRVEQVPVNTNTKPSGAKLLVVTFCVTSWNDPRQTEHGTTAGDLHLALAAHGRLLVQARGNWGSCSKFKR